MSVRSISMLADTESSDRAMILSLLRLNRRPMSAAEIRGANHMSDTRVSRLLQGLERDDEIVRQVIDLRICFSIKLY